MHRISARFFAAILLTLPLPVLAQGTAATPPSAATAPAPRAPSAAQAAQQERMTTCNAEAGKRSLAGDPRRSFMRECLAGRMPEAAAAQPSAAQAAQRERMTTCNTEAGTRKLAGDPRRSFMTECLSGRDTPSVPTAAGGPRG